jgi:hypothetical protein
MFYICITNLLNNIPSNNIGIIFTTGVSALWPTRSNPLKFIAQLLHTFKYILEQQQYNKEHIKAANFALRFAVIVAKQRGKLAFRVINKLSFELAFKLACTSYWTAVIF